MHKPLALVPAAALGIALALSFASTARADGPEAPVSDPSPFDRPFAIGSYATAWHGAYGGIGIGGRGRWEPFELLGFDVFAEHLVVQTPEGLRHDHPIGFNAYIPIQLTTALRLRPLFGFCAVLSFINSDQNDAPNADDVLLGLHAGLGLELALGTLWSAFAEVQASGWLGHDRSVQGWTGAVESSVSPFGVVQAALGVSLHFGAI